METIPRHSRGARLVQRLKDGYVRLHFIIWRCARMIRSCWARTCTAWRWHFNSPGSAHRLPAELVISLTSYPPRFGTLFLTLRSLLRQTVKADHVILWIAHSDFSLLPQNVIRLQTAGLEIRPTEDIKSYKKIIPALIAYPDAFICTADDDVYYWPTWLEELIQGLAMTDRVVTSHCANEIALAPKGGFKPYDQWSFKVRRRGKSNYLFPIGIGGILYPPGILDHTAEDREASLSLCPDADDIWLYWIGARNGATYKTVGRWRDPVVWNGSQKQALWDKNRLGGNDRQIQNMVERYGYPVHIGRPITPSKIRTTEPPSDRVFITEYRRH